MINLQLICYLKNNFSSQILSKSIAIRENMWYNIFCIIIALSKDDAERHKYEKINARK